MFLAAALCMLLGIAAIIVSLMYGTGRFVSKHSRISADSKGAQPESAKHYDERVVSVHEVLSGPNGVAAIVGTRAVHERYEHDVVAHYNEISDADKRVTTLNATQTPGFDLIPNVMFINMERNPERNDQIQSELSRTGFLNSANVFRFEGVAVPTNGAKGCFLSHMHCLAWSVANTQGHVLILEDDFEFLVDREQILQQVSRADSVCSGRWDVIIFGQYVHAWRQIEDSRVFMVQRSTTTSGYLVNRNYIQTLLTKWHQAFSRIPADLSVFRPQDNLDQIQTEFQASDVWLAFPTSIGAQRAGKSIIGDVYVHNIWSCPVDTFDQWSDGAAVHPLTLGPTVKVRSVAVCFVATGRYKAFVPSVARSCVLNFMKPHRLEFHVITDSVKDIPDNFMGCKASAYFTPRLGFPGDTLFRYHYMLKAEERLRQVDHVFYMDVDYWVCNPTDTDALLADGLVATKHVHNLHSITGRDRGTPDTNPKSRAYISPDRKTLFYFCGGFQGGSSAAFLKACRELRARIDEDEANKVMALWHDESHWNAYLADNPPVVVMTQSYVFPEECLISTCMDKNCTLLRKSGLVPRMVALQKNHKEVRA